MREYQEKYLRNLQRVFELNSLPGELPSPEEYLARRAQRAKELKVLSEENTALLRRELFPLLDDIITATEDDISNLEEFAAAMNSRGGVPGPGAVLLPSQRHNNLCPPLA